MLSYEEWQARQEELEDAHFKELEEQEKELKQEFLQLIEVIKKDGLKYIESNLQENWEELDNDIAILASMF